jgi:hypothetical protein
MLLRQREGTRRRSAGDSAVGLLKGPVVLLMLIVARGCVKQSPAGSHILQHPLFPRPWCEPPNRAPGVPAARTDSSIPRHQLHPISPPGCPQIRLRNPTFALLAEYRGLPVARLVERAHRRADLEFRCITSHSASRPVDLLAKPRAIGRCEARAAVLTERRRYCVHPAPILQYSGAVMRLGPPCVVGAVQIAPTPRIRPREVPRHRGSEAHVASKPRPSNLKLALVEDQYGPALCAERSRQIRHVRIVNARPDRCSHGTLSTGQPRPAYSRRRASLQAACSLRLANCMHASRRQQQACVWNAASGGTCMPYYSNRCDLMTEINSPECASACSL